MQFVLFTAGLSAIYFVQEENFQNINISFGKKKTSDILF